MAPRIYTVGSSTRTAAEFLGTLAAFGVRTVADVRRFPVSRRCPHFTREALAGTLRGAGTAYSWLGDDLGGYRSGGYGAYRQTVTFARGLCRLEALAASSPTAILCAERLPWRCHRRFIATALRHRGWELIHILEPDRTWTPAEGEEE
ncbi:MAG: DUF488 domain-containing protein [candidate division NC10 bacterium]